MIFATVGTSSWNFIRFLKEVDRIAGIIDEEVIMQTSDIEYDVKNAIHFSFTSQEEIERIYRDARLIISHAGVGTILSALNNKKPLIIVPRRKEFGEHFDDHQAEIAKELESDNRIHVVWDIKNLESEIKNITSNNISLNKDINLIESLKLYLNKEVMK